MTTPDLDQEKARHEQELKIQRQIAFASGLFQGDVTVRTLLESLAEGVVVIDNSGTILLVNSAAEQMFGYQRNDLIGKPQAVLIPERFRKVHEEHLVPFFAEPRTMETDQLLDLAARRRDGSEFPVEISLSHVETINGVFVMALVSDITVRKEYETRLRDKEEQFHIQVEGVNNYAIFMLDAEGNVLNWNAGAERLKGYRAEEIIGTHFSCFYTEEDRNAGKPEEELKKAAAEGRVAYEGWRIGKDGSRFWADVIITALRDDNGNLRGFSKVTHDITGRKKTKDALRFSEARYRALFHDNPTMIVTLDADLTMLSANPSCASQLGYTIDELEGQSVLRLFHEDDRPAVAEQLQICLLNPDQVYHWQICKIRKDGGLLWVEETAQAVYDPGGAPNILVVCQDITERKKAEEELRHSEERYRRLYNDTPVMLHSIDHDGRLVSVNNYWLETLGYERSEMLGRKSTDFLTAASRTYATEVVLPEFLRTGSCKEAPYQIVKKNGEILDVQLSAIAEQDSEGKVVRSLAVIVDVTARKRAEEMIESLKAGLTEWIAELDIANKDLGAFNYTIAHDLRQPLNIIGLSCQTIKELYGDQLPEECMGYIQDAYNGALHMNQLIEALLEFSRMGHVELHREKVSFDVLAHEVAKMLKKSEPERQVDFRIADGICVDGDPNLLRVVLDNLLGNAWKYTGMQERSIIEFGTTDIEGKPVYFVRDNGIGFDKASVDKLFMPFQRLPAAEECKGKGFGIGLATVERIIRRHGGRVWAEGEPGKGATFWFTIE